MSRINLPAGTYSVAEPAGYQLILPVDGAYLEKPEGPKSLGGLVTPAPSLPSAPVSTSAIFQAVPKWLVTAVMVAACLFLGARLKSFDFAAWIPSFKPSSPSWLPDGPRPPAPVPSPLGLLEGKIDRLAIDLKPAPNDGVIAKLDQVLERLATPAAVPAVTQPVAAPVAQTVPSPAVYYYTTPQTPTRYYYTTGGACYYTADGRQVCR